MALEQSTVESLFRLGHYRKIVAGLGQDHSRIHRYSSLDYRLTIADVLARVGELDAAEGVIATALQSSVDDSVLGKCEAIQGWIARERGRVDEATQRLQHAARLFVSTGNVSQAALVSIFLFRIVSERHRPEAVGPLLDNARTLVTRAGDAHLAAFLHESVARHETQSANLDEAWRHLRIAMALVDSHPNAWLEQLCLISAFCVSVYECDLRTAEESLTKAAALIGVTGAFDREIRNNQGHLYLHLGKFAKAEEILQAVSSTGSGQVAQSAIDGLGRLYLATGRLRDCETALDALSRIQTAPETSFPFRASLVTRIKLLLKQGKWSEAADAAEAAFNQGAKVQDRHLMAAAKFLHAHSLMNDGSSTAAADAISKADSFGAWAIRDYQGEFAYISSRTVLQRGYASFGIRLRARAERIWRDHKNACSLEEFKSGNSVGVAETSSRATQAENDGLIALINSVATAIDVCYSPRLLGAELLDIIQALGCANDARVLETRTDRPENDSAHRKLTLYRDSGRSTVLVCRIPDDPIRANSLADVLRFGEAVVALARDRERERNRAALWPDLPRKDDDALFVAEEMQSLLATARKVAGTNVPVLITGETGTGKEILARAIHAASPRARAPFLPFNCTGTPRDMLDSQLFGHRRGAFTGATDSFQGVIRTAAAGTLFLDEIGDMALDVQPRLLRFLESGEIHPVGEAQPVRVDVRVVAATNAPLDTLVADGRFREDLYYRLNIVHLHVPPLRERRVEIPALAAHYLARHAREFGKGDLRLAEETMEYLVLYRWPGNVRQLANEMRRMAALAETGAVLMPEHLSAAIAASRRTIPASERVLDPTEVVVRLDQPMAAGVQHLERAMVQYAMRKCGGRLEETAAMLGLSRKGLYLKRQRFGLEPPEATAAAL